MADLFLRLLALLTKWKPDWLYKLMPFVYVLASLVTFYYFDSLPGYGAGSLFLIAALLIWKMRIENRAVNAAPLDHSKHSIFK